MKNVYVHENAICESVAVGEGTRVWAFAHILAGARLGRDCNVCDGVFIENDVVVGDRVTIKCGVQLWDGVVLEDDVFVGPNATFTNDSFPRSKVHLSSPLKTIVRKGASIGANVTLLPGIEIGASAMVGAGAVVTRSVPPNAIVVGNPASIVGYVNASQHDVDATPIRRDVENVGVGGVTVHRMPVIHDLRGDLTVGEFSRTVPFAVQRYFIVFDVANRRVRGEHAHRKCKQFLICVRGSCAILVDDGLSRTEVVLDEPSVGLYIPPMVWSVQYKHSSDAVLLVFASDYYDAEDYIRDYDTYRKSVVKT